MSNIKNSKLVAKKKKEKSLQAKQKSDDLYKQQLARESINYLKDQNERLEEMKRELNAQVEKHKSEQNCIVDDLQEKLRLIDNDISKLTLDNSELESSLKQINLEQSSQMESINKDFHKEITELMNNIDDLRNKCSALTKFSVAQESLQKELENYKKNLIADRDDHKMRMTYLHNRGIQETEILKKKMRDAIFQTKENVLTEIKSHLHPTATRAIDKTIQMDREIKYQMQEAEKLEIEAHQYKDEIKALNSRIANYDNQIDSNAKQTSFLKKLLSKLKEKLASHEKRYLDEKSDVITEPRTKRIKIKPVDDILINLRKKDIELVHFIAETKEQISIRQIEKNILQKKLFRLSLHQSAVNSIVVQSLFELRPPNSLNEKHNADETNWILNQKSSHRNDLLIAIIDRINKYFDSQDEKTGNVLSKEGISKIPLQINWTSAPNNSITTQTDELFTHKN